MQTILGAGGTIGTELVRELSQAGKQVRLVGPIPSWSRARPKQCPQTSGLDQTIRAVSGSTVVYLLIGLKYDFKVWRELWPRIMNNAIEACKRANRK